MKQTVKRLVGIIAVAVIVLTVAVGFFAIPNTARAQGQPPQLPPGSIQTVLQDILDELAEIRNTLAAIARPDLIPLAGFPSFENPNPGLDGFCTLENGDLLVTVKNQGLVQAEAFVTRVTFQIPESDDVLVDEIQSMLEPGSSETKNFEIPLGCFAPNCEFTIMVDVDDDNLELNESNNTAQGSCLG